MLFCHLLIFSKIHFSKTSFRNTISLRVSNSLDPDLGPNSLQKVSAEDTSWQIVNIVLITSTHHLYKSSIMPMCLRNCRSSDDFIIFFIKMHAMDEYSETYILIWQGSHYDTGQHTRFGQAEKVHARIQRGGQGVWTPPPSLENHKLYQFL